MACLEEVLQYCFVWSVILTLAGICQAHNDSYQGAMAEPDPHTSCIWEIEWGAPLRSGCCPQILAVKMVLQAIPDPRGPGQMGNGHGNWYATFGKMTPKTCRICSVLLTRNRFQQISGSVPCIHHLCAVIKPAVGSTQKYRQGICITRYLQYATPWPWIVVPPPPLTSRTGVFPAGMSWPWT